MCKTRYRIARFVMREGRRLLLGSIRCVSLRIDTSWLNQDSVTQISQLIQQLLEYRIIYPQGIKWVYHGFTTDLDYRDDTSVYSWVCMLVMEIESQNRELSLQRIVFWKKYKQLYYWYQIMETLQGSWSIQDIQMFYSRQ